MSLARDLSVSAVTAGFVTVLVGFASSAVIVFQAAGAVGATPAQVSSWMLALGVGMGLTSVLLSLRYRVPVVTAWSTPGAALLVTSAGGLTIEEATGAFLVSAALITLAGFSGWFERAMDRIPVAIASGMLAGVLLRFGLDVSWHADSVHVAFGMFAATWWRAGWLRATRCRGAGGGCGGGRRPGLLRWTRPGWHCRAGLGDPRCTAAR